MVDQRSLRDAGLRPVETRLEIVAFVDDNQLVVQLIDAKRPRKNCVQEIEQLPEWLKEERGQFSEHDPAYPLVIKQAIDRLLTKWFEYQAQASNPEGY